jgi:hypothetical protein
MKLYIYSLDTKEVVAIAEGETNAECESKASAYANDYGMTYSAAFGSVDGLIDNSNAEIL